jgi:hypothetical protein
VSDVREMAERVLAEHARYEATFDVWCQGCKEQTGMWVDWPCDAHVMAEAVLPMLPVIEAAETWHRLNYDRAYLHPEDPTGCVDLHMAVDTYRATDKETDRG